ncbi:hypothetical protein ACOMHN_028581 [Nucella lapillus]
MDKSTVQHCHGPLHCLNGQIDSPTLPVKDHFIASVDKSTVRTPVTVKDHFIASMDKSTVQHCQSRTTSLPQWTNRQSNTVMDHFIASMDKSTVRMPVTGKGHLIASMDKSTVQHCQSRATSLPQWTNRQSNTVSQGPLHRLNGQIDSPTLSVKGHFIASMDKSTVQHCQSRATSSPQWTNRQSNTASQGPLYCLNGQIDSPTLSQSRTTSLPQWTNRQSNTVTVKDHFIASMDKSTVQHCHRQGPLHCLNGQIDSPTLSVKDHFIASMDKSTVQHCHRQGPPHGQIDSPTLSRTTSLPQWTNRQSNIGTGKDHLIASVEKSTVRTPVTVKDHFIASMDKSTVQHCHGPLHCLNGQIDSEDACHRQGLLHCLNGQIDSPTLSVKCHFIASMDKSTVQHCQSRATSLPQWTNRQSNTVSQGPLHCLNGQIDSPTLSVKDHFIASMDKSTVQYCQGPLHCLNGLIDSPTLPQSRTTSLPQWTNRQSNTVSQGPLHCLNGQIDSPTLPRTTSLPQWTNRQSNTATVKDHFIASMDKSTVQHCHRQGPFHCLNGQINSPTLSQARTTSLPQWTNRQSNTVTGKDKSTVRTPVLVHKRHA